MVLKRILWPIILTALACLFVIPSGYAQRNGPGRLYRNPVEVRLDRLVKRKFPDYFRGQKPGWEQLLVESFFPIGWSRDGKFAYYTEPVDEACNCYFAKLYILDLKTDKVLWSFDYDSDFIEEGKKQKKPYTLETLWREKRRVFSAKLSEHKIVPQGRFALLPFPIRYNGDQLNADLRIVENADEESRPYGIVSKATLHLTSKRDGTKTLLDTTYPDAKPLDLKVLGYIKSPYEERIAVLMIEVIRGWEGPPNPGQVKIAGAGLATGFK